MDKRRLVKIGFLSLFGELLIYILSDANVIAKSLCCQAKTIEGYSHLHCQKGIQAKQLQNKP